MNAGRNMNNLAIIIILRHTAGENLGTYGYYCYLCFILKMYRYIKTRTICYQSHTYRYLMTQHAFISRHVFVYNHKYLTMRYLELFTLTKIRDLKITCVMTY